MGTDNRLDFPLDRIAKERDEIKGEGLLSLDTGTRLYGTRDTGGDGIINENIFDNNFTIQQQQQLYSFLSAYLSADRSDGCLYRQVYIYSYSVSFISDEMGEDKSCAVPFVVRSLFTSITNANYVYIYTIGYGKWISRPHSPDSRFLSPRAF